MKLLTEPEKAAITQAIKEAEKETSCEIVVAEISHCDDYNSAQFTGGIMVALLMALLSYLFYPLKTPELVLAELMGFLIGFLLITWIPFLRWLLVHRKKMAYEVHFRALAEFYQHGLYKTRAENGILIFLAVFERMVVVLGDKGFNNKIPAGYWETVRNKIITGIKQNRSGEALVETIKSISAELKQYFPAEPNKPNELADEVITES